MNYGVDSPELRVGITEPALSHFEAVGQLAVVAAHCALASALEIGQKTVNDYLNDQHDQAEEHRREDKAASTKVSLTLRERLWHRAILGAPKILQCTHQIFCPTLRF